MPDPILLRQSVPITAYKPRAYLNGFPKAGLHLLEQMAGVMLGRGEVGTSGSQWLGTYKFHSWTMQWQDVGRILWRLSCQERGTYLMGHSGYHEDIRRMLDYGNILHILIYRDLRDVAVSQAHHIFDEDMPGLMHEHKDFYRMLGGFDEVLMAVIEGIGPYPGVVERWTEYAPWLDCDEVLALRFEEMRAKPHESAARIILRLVKIATERLEGNTFGVEMDPEDVKKLAGRMVEATKEPSPTFRKGKAGGWREEFKPEHVEVFKRSDPDGWLGRLGYSW